MEVTAYTRSCYNFHSFCRWSAHKVEDDYIIKVTCRRSFKILQWADNWLFRKKKQPWSKEGKFASTHQRLSWTESKFLKFRLLRQWRSLLLPLHGKITDIISASTSRACSTSSPRPRSTLSQLAATASATTSLRKTFQVMKLSGYKVPQLIVFRHRRPLSCKYNHL